VQLLKQFYCARKLRHKLPQFIAVCVMDLSKQEKEVTLYKRSKFWCSYDFGRGSKNHFFNFINIKR